MKIEKSRKTIRWTPEIIDFIKVNYPLVGSVGCSVQLNLPVCKIQDIVKFYKIKMPIENRIFLINKRINENKIYKINTEMFMTPLAPEICYLLGLLWADGSIKGTLDNSIRITLKKEDAEDVKDLFNFSGKWSIKECQHKCHKNPVVNFRCCDKTFYNFLHEMNYHIKSGASASKIINRIPLKLQHYWWRGYFDGDGSLNKNNYGINITSTIDQDWEFLKYLPSSISYKIKKYIRKVNGKTQSCSRFIIWGKGNVIGFLRYIYSGNVFGIQRKYNRYQNKLKFGYKGK